MDKPAKQFDYERAMLWGDRLRVLLNSDHISNGEITETLKEREYLSAAVKNPIPCHC